MGQEIATVAKRLIKEWNSHVSIDPTLGFEKSTCRRKGLLRAPGERIRGLARACDR